MTTNGSAATGERARTRASRWLWGLVLAHLAWGATRLPGKVFAQRIDEVAAFRSGSPEQWFFAASGLDGAEVVTWLREHTPPRCVVLWEGERLGAMEFAAALLAPRLFVSTSRCADGPSYAGLPIATTSEHGREARLVVVADHRTLRLDRR